MSIEEYQDVYPSHAPSHESKGEVLPRINSMEELKEVVHNELLKLLPKQEEEDNGVKPLLYTLYGIVAAAVAVLFISAMATGTTAVSPIKLELIKIGSAVFAMLLFSFCTFLNVHESNKKAKEENIYSPDIITAEIAQSVDTLNSAIKDHKSGEVLDIFSTTLSYRTENNVQASLCAFAKSYAQVCKYRIAMRSAHPDSKVWAETIDALETKLGFAEIYADAVKTYMTAEKLRTN